MSAQWIGLGIILVMALAALRPPRRPAWAREVAYHLGWVINEAPLVWFLLVAGSIGLTLYEHDGGSSDPGLIVSLALDTVLAAVLIVLQMRVIGVRRVFDRALQEELGYGLPARSRWSVAAQGVGSVLLPWRRRRLGVRHLRNIAYAEHGYRNLLDVYLSRDRRPVGVFVHFHGGHFRIGRKNTQSLPLLYDLAREGWICVSANYRLEPRASFPDFVVDAKRAVAWARRTASEQGIDPDMVVAAGDSAGANLAMFLGATPGDPRFQPGFEDEDTRVAAVVALYGYYGPTSADAASSPLAHLTEELPPLLMVHGRSDSSVPVAWGREALAQVRAVATNPVVYVEPRFTQHTFDYLRSPRCDALIETTVRFLARVRDERTRHPEGSHVR